MPWNANDLKRIEHEPQADEKADVDTFNYTEDQTRCHKPEVDQEVEKGSGTDARLYSAPYDYPFLENPWAYFITQLRCL